MCNDLSSLLAKIFNFGNYVCLFVSLSVCLSVCLSVIDAIQATPFEQSTPNLTKIWNLFGG